MYGLIGRNRLDMDDNKALLMLDSGKRLNKLIIGHYGIVGSLRERKKAGFYRGAGA